MKASEMRTKSPQVLRENLRAYEASLVSLRMEKSVGQLRQNHKFSQLKNLIARVQTVLTELAKNSPGEATK